MVVDTTLNEEVTFSTEPDGDSTTKRYPACLQFLCHLFPCFFASEENGDGETSHTTNAIKLTNGPHTVSVFMGGATFTVPIEFDSLITVAEDISIMPVFWFKHNFGWALVVSRIGGEGSNVFERVGFLGVDGGFWQVFGRYQEVCAEGQDVIRLV